MRQPIRVIVVEDQPDDAELMVLALQRGGFDPVWERVATADGLRTCLADGPWDAVLSDYTMPEFGAVRALEVVRATDPHLPFLVVSGTVGEEVAVELMRAGANDYVLKGNLVRLAPAVKRELLAAEDRGARRAAERAARQLVAIVSDSDYAIFSQTLAGIVTSWNAGAERLYGYTAEEMTGKHVSILSPADRSDESGTARERIERGEHVSAFDTVRLHKSGRRLDVSLSLSPIRDVKGRVVGVSRIATNISERKRADEALMRSEERYRTLIEATVAMVWNSPASGAFDTDQPSWTAFTGQTVEEHRGYGWLDVIHPDDRERSGRAWAAAVEQRTMYQLEHRIRRADGEYREMTVRALPIFDGEGTIREWVGVHTDVTDQKHAEADSLSSQSRLQHVLASSPVVVFTLSLADRRITGLTWISENFRELLGYRPETGLVPDWWLRNIHSEELDRVVSITDEELFAKGYTACEYRIRHATGRYVWIRSEIRLVRDEHGVPVEAVGAWLDITSFKRMEDQFHQSQKMDAFGQLAGGVAHDFNNLLTIINGYSEILLEQLPARDPSRDMVAEIFKAGERSAGLTRQLLAFSRQSILAPRVLDLNVVVSDTDKMLKRLIGEDIRLTTLLDSDLGAVRADPGQIEQVLMNLVVNARDAMPRGGHLTVETRNTVLDESYVQTRADARAGRYIVLSVTDTGKGMTPEVLGKIFEPFFTTKGVGKGTGLGLATVYGIVKQSGGHVSVYSEVGIGTSFKVYLPRVKRPSGDSVIRAPVKAAPSRGVETILLAEDDTSVRAMTRGMLIALGYTVIDAYDGVEAARLAAEHIGPIHLLITDVVMPRSGGQLTAEAVVAQHPETRVLFMSGYTDDAVIRHGVLREGVNFLQKPFSPAYLAAKVRDVLDDSSGAVVA